MNYSSYEPEDFAVDAFFCQWVLYPSEQLNSFWTDWLESHPDKRTDIEMARQLVLLASTEDGEAPSEATVERIWENIEEGRQAHVIALRHTRNSWIKIAAAVALVLLTAGGYFYQKIQNNTYRTAYGESKKLSLPDGSLVTLNAHSSLRVSDHWGQPREREVWLEGEAFFTVSKIRRQGNPVKFIVHTHDLNVEVKGTEFNVNTRKNQTRVVLSEGLVHLYLNNFGKNKEIRMQPGDLVDFSSHNQKLSIRHLPDTSPIHSWKNKRWTLNDTSLNEIADLIRETYGVTVSISGDSLAKQKVNGIVPTDNMEDLLSALESILPVNISRHEDIVTIRERP